MLEAEQKTHETIISQLKNQNQKLLAEKEDALAELRQDVSKLKQELLSKDHAIEALKNEIEQLNSRLKRAEAQNAPTNYQGSQAQEMESDNKPSLKPTQAEQLQQL